MNINAELQPIIEEIKADKSIIQPYKNYALKAAEELKAWIHMGQTTTTQKYNQEPICTCPGPGAIAKDCLVHNKR